MAEFEYLTTNINKEENEMGKFYDIAESILERIEEEREGISRDDEREILEYDGEENIRRRGLTVDQIRKSVYNITSENINFYPGIPGAPCYDLAVFVSLNSSNYVRGRKHLKCRAAMEKIVQHMQGNCIQQTKNAVFVTDFWDGLAFEDWKGNLEQIRDNSHFEIYLIAGHTISQIKI